MRYFKKLSLAFLCIFVMSFVLGGCSIEKTSSQVETEALETIREGNVEIVAQYTQSGLAALMVENDYEYVELVLESGQQIASPLFQNDFMYRWKQFIEKHGKVMSAEVDETMREGSEYTSRIILTGEDGGQMAMTVTYDESLTPVSTTIADYSDDSQDSLGAKMKTAAGNTATGLITVFAVLVLLIFVISAFNFLPKESSGKKAPEAPAAKPVVAVAKQEEVDLKKNEELVAVIAAAIAASEGQSTDDFVVRSIKRLHNNKWR